MWNKQKTYHEVDNAGNAEADTSEDSCEYETSRYTDSKKDRQKTIKTSVSSIVLEMKKGMQSGKKTCLS